MGNIPSKNQGLLDLMKKAIDKEVIIVIISQCHKGGVNDLYEAGRVLIDLGAVLGLDMTVECCYAKLSYLLGKQYSKEKIKRKMMSSIRGDLTDIKTEKETFSIKSNTMVRAIAQVLKAEGSDDYK
jgi:L-asparaginase/Glu-tRNA(Gln) amidotransferase subunit D